MVRLYDRWLATGSPRAAALLAERGIAPVSPLGERAALRAPPGSRVGELAVDVQRRLEAFYALDPEAPVTDYLIPSSEAAHVPGAGSHTLVAQEGDEVSVGVVLDEATRAHLSGRPAGAARPGEPPAPSPS